MAIGLGTGGILTVKNVADYFGLTERTIFRLAAKRQIATFRVGRSGRLSLANVDSWIKQKLMEGLDIGREDDGAAKGQSNCGERK